MKRIGKIIITLAMGLMMCPSAAFSQNYSALWKQVKSAQEKDLPQTQIKVLEQIISRAENDMAYGQLMKAELMRMQAATDINADSLKPAVRRMEKKMDTCSDKVLKAVYATVLSKIYERNEKELTDDDTNSDTSITTGAASSASKVSKADEYAAEALSYPDALAAAKADDYEPLTIEGYNANIFDDDMLSVIGNELERYSVLFDYYSKAGNRRAACIAAMCYVRKNFQDKVQYEVNKSPYLHALDSIIHTFADLDVAGEVAVERYNGMTSCKNVKIEDQISYIHYALEKWGAWQRMSELRNEERRLTAPMFSINASKNVARPDEKSTVYVSQARNIGSLTLNFYKLNVDGETTLNPENPDDYKKLKNMMSEYPQQSKTLSFMGNPNYQIITDSILVDAMPTGVYLMEATTSPTTEVERRLFFVTDNYLLSQRLPDDEIRYVAVSATTGQPLKNAKLKIYLNGGRNRNGEIKTDTIHLSFNGKGEAVYSIKETLHKMEKLNGYSADPMRAYLYTADDRAFPVNANRMAYGGFSYTNSDGNGNYTNLFTDRSIYRPGQTVQVAAVIYKKTSWIETEIEASKTVKAVLRDANRKIVSEKEITTDEYGTCSTEFILPENGLTGRFTVSINGKSKTIRVEQYKRPTFKVEFPEVNSRYESGDTLLIQAKAVSYAGVPVQGATVKYRVYRKGSNWWRARYINSAIFNSGDELLKEAEGITDGDGRFEVELPLVLPEESKKIRTFYNFSVEADVTDISGETRSGSMSLPLGSRRTDISSSLRDKELADSLKSITIYLKNNAGINVNTPVRFQIDGNGKWLEGRTMTAIPLPERLTSGRHNLYALCDSDTLRQDFIVFGLNDKVPCVETDDWFYVSDGSFSQDGKPVVIQVGSSAKDVHVVYSVMSGKKVLESGSFSLDNSIHSRKLIYKKDYGNGLLVTYAWVRDGKCYKHSTKITRPVPDKQLNMKWTTFRDRLLPGQQEEWSLSIVGPDGKPADAQLMATMYDASLDQIMKHSWDFSVNLSVPTPNTRWNNPYTRTISMYASQSYNALKFRSFEFTTFDSSIFPSNNIIYIHAKQLLGATRMMKRSAANANVEMLLDVEAVANAASTTASGESADASQGSAADDATDYGNIEENIRENMNETAFFFPSLIADKTGNVMMKFTLPESLTTWKFMGVAHTKDVCVGMLEDEAVAQKEVMTQPNLPRFVRVGDKTQIAAKVFNTGNAKVSGVVRVEFSNPETGEVYLADSKTFSADVDKTAVVTFDFTPEGKSPLLVCKVVSTGRSANGTFFSDGEQHYLPVLPDRERVTVSVPFIQNEAGVKKIDVSSLFKVKDASSKLTVEYTNNPAWMMVQALPTMSAPRDNNAIDQGVAVYANTLARMIAQSDPKIKSTFTQWKNEIDQNSLLSNLTKNIELKDIVLGETPWMTDVTSENDQKHALAVLFDDNAVNARLMSAVSKLQKLQNEDGSWSWWQGMRGSTYMTAEIAGMIARMNAMTAATDSDAEATATIAETGSDKECRVMLALACGYLDREMAERVKRMKEEESKGNPPTGIGDDALKYLYINAISGRTLSDQAKSTSSYLINVMKKEIKSQSIYDKAMSAVILGHAGERKKALEYAKSLKEYTTYKEEMGRYFETKRAGYSWMDYRIPTQVAAIEALKNLTPNDTETITEMQRWLLQEKRTQGWSTPVNSVNAIYAFLMDGSGQLEHKVPATLALDGKAMELPQATAGFGYVKTAVDGKDVNTFTATKTSKGTSWGAVYAQFMQKTSDIESSGSGISVKREIITSDQSLKVGSRIKVRITITADRDLDFVQVLDRRASCMEPVEQLSGYRNGAYCSPKDNTTNYYYDMLPKGKHVIETEYFIDRAGTYETGTCTVSCAYAPEYRATVKSAKLVVK